MRFWRVALIVPAFSLTLALGACDSFDPTSIFDAEIFNTKKKLPGERTPVFPEGTPGVPQGVPPELVKGYQPPAEQEPAREVEAKPKPKPKPRVVARPKPESKPTAVTVRPVQAPQPPPTAQQQPSQSAWPDPPPMQQAAPGGVVWPDPPPVR